MKRFLCVGTSIDTQHPRTRNTSAVKTLTYGDSLDLKHEYRREGPLSQ